MIDAPAIMNRIFPVLGYHYQAQTGGRAVPLPSLADWPHPYPHRHAPGIFFVKKSKYRSERISGVGVIGPRRRRLQASGELYWQTNFADTCTRENVVGNCPVSWQLPATAPTLNRLID
jgi:hypothetical protein